jgi:hypothetical protein
MMLNRGRRPHPARTAKSKTTCLPVPPVDETLEASSLLIAASSGGFLAGCSPMTPRMKRSQRFSYQSPVVGNEETLQ